MKQVLKKLVAVLSTAAMLSTLFVSVQAADEGSFDAFSANFSVYNYGKYFGPDKTNAGEITQTAIDGGKQITLDNTIAKIQFRASTTNVPTGYEWYTVSATMKADAGITFDNVPYVYEAGEVSGTNVITVGINDSTEAVAKYIVKSTSSASASATIFRGNFTDWNTFKYVVHNTAEKTTVYAFFNGNYVGSVDRSTPAVGIGNMFFQTRSTANVSGSVYLKDVVYTWSNEAIKIPNKITVDNCLMNSVTDNAKNTTNAKFGYDATNDAIAMYSPAAGPLFRYFASTSNIAPGHKFYKTSFTFKRDSNYGAGTMTAEMKDSAGTTAVNFVFYRKFGWNQIQLKNQSNVQMTAVASYKDETAWGKMDVYYDVDNNTILIYLNDVERCTYQPNKPLTDLQYMQFYVNDVAANYTKNDGTTAPLQYFVKDYETSWGEHDLRYPWEDDEDIELVNANIAGVAIDTTIGALSGDELAKVSITNAKTGEAVAITGSTAVGHTTYIDADLAIGTDYVLTVPSGVTGISGEYLGADYKKGFRFRKVYEQLGSDWAGQDKNNCNAPTNIGDVYFVSATVPNNITNGQKISNLENFTQVYDYQSYRMYNNKYTWSNTQFRMNNGTILQLQQNINGESYDKIVVNGTSKEGVTLETPLGMGTVNMNRDSNNDPDGTLLNFTDASGNAIDTPDEITTHQEVYSVSNDSFRVSSDVSGTMKEAYGFADEDDVFSNTGYVQIQASGRLLFGVKRIYTTVPEFFNPDEYTFELTNYGNITKNEANAGIFYTVKVNQVDQELKLSVAEHDFTITGLGTFDVATSLTYAIFGNVETASTDIAITSGSQTYTKVE